jgi:hypothetical protein
MNNVRIKNLNVNDDLNAAIDILNGKLIVKQNLFYKYSMIYRTTNEYINNTHYINNIKNKKRILSVTASGDQIINSILYGTKDITGVDISIFPKYYFILKLVALKNLSKQDYLDFIVGDIDKSPLSLELYSKIRHYLKKEISYFWDNILYSFDGEKIERSPLFGNYIIQQKTMINHNPYLNEGNFEKIKTMIDDVSIQLIDYDLFNINNLEIGKFDLINLSSLINYICPNGTTEEIKVKKYQEFVNKLPLLKNGIVITYNFSFDGELSSYFHNKDYNVYKIDEEILPFHVKNELIVYTKPKKKILSMFGKK